MSAFGHEADSFTNPFSGPFVAGPSVSGPSRRGTAVPPRTRAWRKRFRRRAIAADVVAILATLSLTHVALLLQDRLQGQPMQGSAVLPVFVGALWLGALLIAHGRSPRHLGTGMDEYRRTVAASIGTFGAVAIASALSLVPVPRLYFALALPLGLLALIGGHWLGRRALRRARLRGESLSRVIVLGARDDVAYVIGQIERRRGTVEYEVVGVAVASLGAEAPITVRGHTIPVVGAIDRVTQSVRSLGADAVIVAGPVDGGNAFLRRLGWSLEETGTELVLSPGLTNVAGPRIHWRPVEGLPLISVELPQYSGTRHLMKRCLDVLLSAAALVALAPLLLVLAALVRREGPGPIVFSQQRIGRNGEPFTIYKFRSMTVDAEERLTALAHLNESTGPLFKIRDDPRVTRIGRVMRRYSLDELPQFWNVLRGDMSLVGPRPPLAREVQSYDATVNRRLYIKPGITGMWQINGRSELDWEDGIRLDLYYVENWSLTGDLIILWRTAWMLLRPVGAY
ncbi:sugar transferase [Microbacteriaceae bacterium VKM Ac-2854]|nr:sugar transferase [Microbacteriaceae bacterium VKM Ac-2854]